MAELHVMADARGTWQVRDDAQASPLSEHPSATAAELAAWVQCDKGRGDSVVVHDRYGRTRDALPFGRRRGKFQRSGSPSAVRR